MSPAKAQRREGSEGELTTKVTKHTKLFFEHFLLSCISCFSWLVFSCPTLSVFAPLREIVPVFAFVSGLTLCPNLA
jgi:hypothetical protein